MEYLEERFPEPALWPADPAERALGRLWLDRFDARLGHEYYALRRGDPSRLDERVSDVDDALEAQPYLSGRQYGLADIGYLPWILRARSNLGFELEPYAALSAWLERLSERPAVAAELELTAALGR
jgi:glutathione S-transferase